LDKFLSSQVHDGQLERISEDSIEELLDRLPPPAVDVEPLQLLAICALLPSGLFPVVFGQVTSCFRDPFKATRSLLNHGLAGYGLSGELNVLSSVRTHVAAHYPATPSHALKLANIYVNIASELPLARLPGWEARKAASLTEFTNICAILTPLLERAYTRLLLEAIKCLITFSISAGKNVPHLTDMESLQNGHMDVHLRAHYTDALIYHRFGRGEYSVIRELLSPAVVMHNQCRTCRMYSVARAMVLAEIDRIQGRFDGASRRLAQLRITAEQLNDDQVLASYHAHCGRVEVEQHNYMLARLHFRIAVFAYGRAGNEANVLDATTWLAQIELSDGNVAVAYKSLEETQTLSKLSENHQVLGRCISLLGQVHMIQGRFLLAEQCALDAWRLETTRGHRFSIAECDYQLAVILAKLQRGTEATEAAGAAARAYRTMEIEHRAQSCERLIERIAVQSAGDTPGEEHPSFIESEALTTEPAADYSASESTDSGT